VQTYLASRAIVLPPPPVIRFHPNLKHFPSGESFPAMVCRVTRVTDGAFLGVHRTYLRPDGLGKAPVSPVKMLLGACRGGVIRLAEPSGRIGASEGVEDALTVMQASGLPVWAALSAGGLASLELPPSVAEVLLIADADAPGEAAAMNAANRFAGEGRRVRIARPRGGAKDFNEMLIGSAVRNGKIAI
jgi:hypothetical protein